jgi:hypothetical protein
LSQYELPVSAGAQVRVTIERPDGTAMTMTLAQTEPGIYEGSFIAAVAGVYHLRFRATGKSLAGFPFTREALRTAAVTPGGDIPPDYSTDDDPWDRICEIIECLLRSDRLREHLAKFGLDERTLRECFGKVCRRQPAGRPVAALDPTLVNDLTRLLQRPEVRRLLTEREMD